MTNSSPEIGQVVTVRQKKFVVTDVLINTLESGLINQVVKPETHVVHLSSLEDDDLGGELSVIWELEPGVKIEEKISLPKPSRFDSPERLDAFMNAVRWGAISSSDTRQLQAPFRSGIEIEDYQLEPLVRALQMPRANLLIADDVGLGKTIEAGLVIQELLFRNRARSVLVVCPAGLQIHWKEQMREHFGLDFRIVDNDCLRELRRSRGIHANPWSHFPRLITSIDFIKRDYPLRLFKEILPPHVTYPRRFDILIVDEAHNVSPSGSGQYAVESQRTQTIRSITPHFEHRLFLSATPHNGYKESFTALLELLDDQRFARSVDPNREQLKRVMVRRLKTDLPPRWDGTPRYLERIIEPIRVDYSDAEKHIHDVLDAYHTQRIKHASSASEKLGSEFVLKLLKKRLFSSPMAFNLTLEKHIDTITKGKKKKQTISSEGILRRQIKKIENSFADDEEKEQEEEIALDIASNVQREISDQEQILLDELSAWGKQAANRADTKTKTFIDWLENIVKTDGKWNDERVIIFTEYRATQNYLQLMLASRDLTSGDRLKLIYGGMDEEERERILKAFQNHPRHHPVRILLATDTASEGIDLQKYCHLLVHYEIPWNPNRMEQRNGRIDRFGQEFHPEIYHFVGSAIEDIPSSEAGSMEADLEFLWRAIQKVEQIREDLGSVGPVIADSIEKAMINKDRSLDTSMAEMKAQEIRKLITFEADQKKKINDYLEQLNESKGSLHISPENIKKVVDIALELAGQPPLIPVDPKHALADKGFFVQNLQGSWQKCMHGIPHPLTGEPRPIIFDQNLTKDWENVVHAHLNHQLVQMAIRLLRAEVWAPETEKGLSRVTARLVPNDLLDTPAVIAHARLVVIGGDNQRLHEELIFAGGEIREGRFRRIEQLGRIEKLLGEQSVHEPSDGLKEKLQHVWDAIEDNLMLSLEARRKQRLDGMLGMLTQNEQKEIENITAILQELETEIRSALKDPDFVQLELFGEQEEQLKRDITALQYRLSQIPEEIRKETQRIHDHYANPQARMFPVAVEFLVPEKLGKGE